MAAGEPARARQRCVPGRLRKRGDQPSSSSLTAVTSTSRLASASPTRAAFERLGLRGVLSHVLAGQASARGLTCRESPVASSASRCGLDVRAHCWRFAGRGSPRGAGISPTVGPGSCPVLTSAASGPPPADEAFRFRCWRSLARRRSSVRAVIRTRRMPTGVAPARACFRTRRRSAPP